MSYGNIITMSYEVTVLYESFDGLIVKEGQEISSQFYGNSVKCGLPIHAISLFKAPEKQMKFICPFGLSLVWHELVFYRVQRVGQVQKFPSANDSQSPKDQVCL